VSWREPEVWGVVNLTEDSFSDGGKYLAPERAIEHARRLWSEGAGWIDLGPASSHPDAREVPAREEIARLAPVVDALHADGVRISIDSFRPETQAWALERGAAALNDVRGFPDPSLYPSLARAEARLVVMHRVDEGDAAVRVRTDPEEVEASLDAFVKERIPALIRAGVARERLILDPGMGFFLGDTPGPSLRVLGRLAELRERYGLPILVCASRKSFLGAVTGASVEARGPATLAAELWAARSGADHVRTHDVRALRDALAVESALHSARR
jgi:dihydropteroate synthase type 2